VRLGIYLPCSSVERHQDEGYDYHGDRDR